MFTLNNTCFNVNGFDSPSINTNIDQTPILEHHGEYEGKTMISSKLLAQSLAFATFSPFLFLRIKMHLTEMFYWVSSSSKYTSCFFQLPSSFIFVIIKISEYCISLIFCKVFTLLYDSMWRLSRSRSKL